MSATRLTREQRDLVDHIVKAHSVGVHPSLLSLGTAIERAPSTIRRRLARLADLDGSPVVSIAVPGGSGATRIVLRDCPCERCVAGREEA